MPQIQVLDFKPVPRPESVGNDSNEQLNQGKHCDVGCANFPYIAKCARTEFSGTTGSDFFSFQEIVGAPREKN
jgi:hypothetical protein